MNSIVRHHNRTVYSSQALRHVAEQIDELYWASGAPDTVLTGYGDDVLVKGINLNDSEWVHVLSYHFALEAEVSGC